MRKHIKKCPSEDNNRRYAEGKLSIIVTTNEAREKIKLEKLEKLLPTRISQQTREMLQNCQTSYL